MGNRINQSAPQWAEFNELDSFQYFYRGWWQHQPILIGVCMSSFLQYIYTHTLISSQFYIIHSIRYVSRKIRWKESTYSHEAVCSQGFAVSLREFRPRGKNDLEALLVSGKCSNKLGWYRWWCQYLVITNICIYIIYSIYIYMICICLRTLFQPSHQEIYPYFPGESATDNSQPPKPPPWGPGFSLIQWNRALAKVRPADWTFFFGHEDDVKKTKGVG